MSEMPVGEGSMSAAPAAAAPASAVPAAPAAAAPAPAAPAGSDGGSGGDAPSKPARVYLDYAATAPFDERLAPLLGEVSWANPNSLHTQGREAFHQLEDARARLASALKAHEPAEIIFTSGGTESDNTACLGLSGAASGKAGTHVVMSAIEHEAVLDCAVALKRQGVAVDLVYPDRQGVVGVDALETRLSAIEDAGGTTTLVAIMAVNNELGTIQPVRDLAACAHSHGALFFTDGVQALGKIPINLEASGVDAAAFAAHKIGGPKGVGALYVRRGIRCPAYLHGGGQESGLRSGTQNVFGASAFAHSAEFAVDGLDELSARLASFKAQVLDFCRTSSTDGTFAHALIPTVDAATPQVPHVLSMLADGLEGEMLVLRADNAGISISSGSACSTGSLEPSHVLSACKVPKEQAFGAVRISFGYKTTQGDIDALLAALAGMLR